MRGYISRNGKGKRKKRKRKHNGICREERERSRGREGAGGGGKVVVREKHEDTLIIIAGTIWGASSKLLLGKWQEAPATSGAQVFGVQMSILAVGHQNTAALHGSGTQMAASRGHCAEGSGTRPLCLERSSRRPLPYLSSVPRSTLELPQYSRPGSINFGVARPSCPTNRPLIGTRFHEYTSRTSAHISRGSGSSFECSPPQISPTPVSSTSRQTKKRKRKKKDNRLR